MTSAFLETAMNDADRLFDVVRTLYQDPPRTCDTVLRHLLDATQTQRGCIVDLSGPRLRASVGVTELDREILSTLQRTVQPTVVRKVETRCALPLKLQDDLVGAAILCDPTHRACFDGPVLDLCYVLAGAAAVAIGRTPAIRSPQNPVQKPNMLGRSEAMARLARDIERIAPAPYPVLVEGESGTGKELVARRIHEVGPRRQQPYVAVNCAGIPASLLEAELFGSVRGAYTGAETDRAGILRRADRGTLFLDELETMPLPMQEALLRFIETGELQRVGAPTVRADVRIVSATNVDLDQLVRERRFRPDLYFRMNVLRLRVPPLRERPDDIPLLARHFCDKAAAETQAPARHLDASAYGALDEHDWPGNVRELENAVRRATIAGRGPTLSADDFAFLQAAPRRTAPELMSLDEYVRHAVTSFGSRLSVSELARRLGISRKTLWAKKRELALLET